MSAPWGTIMDALVAWAVAETGFTTIWAHQNKPHPQPPYVLLNIIARRAQGQVEIQPPDTDEEDIDPVRLVSRIDFTVSVNCLAAPKVAAADALGKQQAQDMIDKLTLSLAKQSVINAFEDAGFASIEETGSTDATTPFEAMWSDRAQADIIFSTISAVVDDTDIIQSVDVLGKFVRPDGSELIDWIPLTDDFDSPSWPLNP